MEVADVQATVDSLSNEIFRLKPTVRRTIHGSRNADQLVNFQQLPTQKHFTVRHVFQTLRALFGSNLR